MEGESAAPFISSSTSWMAPPTSADTGMSVPLNTDSLSGAILTNATTTAYGGQEEEVIDSDELNNNDDGDADSTSSSCCEEIKEALDVFLNGPTTTTTNDELVDTMDGGRDGLQHDFMDTMMMRDDDDPPLRANSNHFNHITESDRQKFHDDATSWLGRSRQVSDCAVSSEQDTPMDGTTTTTTTTTTTDGDGADVDSNNPIGMMVQEDESVVPLFIPQMELTAESTSDLDPLMTATNIPPPSTTIMTGRLPTVLYLSCNPDYLSPYQCLIRKQVQLFEASPTDVGVSIKGRNKPIVLGQVGIQCFHCAYSVSPQNRARGAVYYPHTLKGIYQAAQILCTTHLLDTCTYIPTHIKEELHELRSQKSQATAGKEYWANTASVLGVYEDSYGLRFTPTFAGVVAHHHDDHEKL
jgi:hypothetical protein